MTQHLLRLGTRGSPLALRQAEEVQARLAAAHGIDPSAVAIEVIRTTGDRIQDRTLAEAGGKGLFTKEIEEALIAGTIDFAVHSSKDVPTFLPDGLQLSTYLPREDVRDAFVSPRAASLATLPPGAVVGTASLRRQAQVLRARPDLRVVPLRGNVQTRLRKLEDGAVDATLLALAGLNRLKRADVVTALLPLDQFLPAIGQGAIAIETRANDSRTIDLLSRINDPDTEAALTCERAFLTVLDGSCRTPIAGLATIDGNRIEFTGEVLREDGSEHLAEKLSGNRQDAEAIGREAGARIKQRLPANFFKT
ncbi:porphobilinogen deaminase [Variibacter gotjawalensis]|uniref:Porphobilinogen deaminase n=1 Tax=Variibacter gotjawalensis TaxID=1333996 RepID=A0A0S3PNP4_9BRAD|nr:hydroxymethylbilane synthase [Variibacter gotjawalensis]NIK47824.1 hydroxymethylbilane synthase [Variibacter gotjawalensis]RZS49711.1 hydroxymethylbilane synthase [Variibacter gotjawalensis]BAT57540.1 porphobilinogen deaminase [Variibacter gotjawalensis]